MLWWRRPRMPLIQRAYLNLCLFYVCSSAALREGISCRKKCQRRKVNLWMKIKVVPPFCMLLQLVSAGPSERSFQENNLSWPPHRTPLSPLVGRLWGRPEIHFATGLTYSLVVLETTNQTTTRWFKHLHIKKTTTVIPLWVQQGLCIKYFPSWHSDYFFTRL